MEMFSLKVLIQITVNHHCELLTVLCQHLEVQTENNLKVLNKASTQQRSIYKGFVPHFVQFT